jgi:hypothetical protein
LLKESEDDLSMKEGHAGSKIGNILQDSSARVEQSQGSPRGGCSNEEEEEQL